MYDVTGGWIYFNIDLFSFISENLEELKKEYEKVMEMIKQKPKEKSKCMSIE